MEHSPVIFCSCPSSVLSSTMRLHSIGKTVWQTSCCRVAHQGSMQAWGWCTRYAKVYQFWDHLHKPVTQLISSLWKDMPTSFSQFLRNHASNIQLGKPATAGRPGGACAFLGHNYVPSAPDPQHGPPMAVAQQLRVRVATDGCHSHCKTCATAGCVACTRCPVHTESVNRSWAVLVLYQGRRTPREHRAWFVIGGEALDIRGGLVVSSVVSQCRRSPFSLQMLDQS